MDVAPQMTEDQQRLVASKLVSLLVQSIPRIQNLCQILRGVKGSDIRVSWPSSDPANIPSFSGTSHAKTISDEVRNWATNIFPPNHAKPCPHSRETYPSSKQSNLEHRPQESIRQGLTSNILVPMQYEDF